MGSGYNDLPSLDAAALKAHRGRVAGIILEPTLFDAPAPGFLESVRERATKHKALLIFDEVVTGWRWAVGGYQVVCGVTPDLAMFGKSIANGFPVGAVVGPGRYVQKADCCSGTYVGNAGAWRRTGDAGGVRSERCPGLRPGDRERLHGGGQRDSLPLCARSVL